MKRITKTTVDSGDRTLPVYPMLILVLIVVFGFALRIWRLDQAPSGALIDELHFGYIAHSLNETGKDEHGLPYPVIFKGFGDQKLPAYAYALMPVIRLLGLTVTAIRLPSVIAGTLLIACMYFLVLEVTKSRTTGLFGALLTAVSPWTFFLSRIGFESNLGLLFFSLGLLFLMKASSQNKTWMYMLSAVLWALTWYSYIAYRPVTVALAIIFFLSYKIPLKNIAQFSLVLFIAILPLFSSSAIAANSTRFNQIGITNDPGHSLIINEQRTFCAMKLPSQVCYAMFNKPLLISKQLISRTLRALSPQFMSTVGEDEEFLTVKGFGQIYSSVYLLFLLGVAVVLLTPFLNQHKRVFITLALAVSPIPALLAGEPQKVRISPFFPFVLLAMCIGFAFIIKYLDTYKKYFKFAFLGAIVCILLFQTAEYMVSYFGMHVTQHEDKYQSFVPTISQYIYSLPNQPLVVIKPFYSDPLMFYAFYTKMSPHEYQKKAVLGQLESSGFQHTVGLNNIHVAESSLDEVACLALLQQKDGYYVTNEELMDVPPVFEVKSSNGVHTYAYVYQAQPLLADCK